jgi:hypothetical protein
MNFRIRSILLTDHNVRPVWRNRIRTRSSLGRYSAIFALLFVPLFVPLCFGQKDPGIRGGPPGAGSPIPGLTLNELALFNEGKLRAIQLEAVCDTCSDVTLGADTGQDPNLATLTNSSGLGVRFNGDQCSVCHQQPAIGGSGGFLVPNPQDLFCDETIYWPGSGGQSLPSASAFNSLSTSAY